MAAVIVAVASSVGGLHDAVKDLVALAATVHTVASQAGDTVHSVFAASSSEAVTLSNTTGKSPGLITVMVPITSQLSVPLSGVIFTVYGNDMVPVT